MAEGIELSVVVPAYNEEGNIGPLCERVFGALEAAAGAVEIVLVDDGSSDGTWQRIAAAARRDDRVRGLRFARNFGHQAAVTAGIDAARGRAAVIIDADLQDPPEVIPEMVERWREGFEVVYGKRERREGETMFKRATAALFYRVLRGMTSVDIPVDTGDFRLMGPRALAAFRALPEHNRFIRGLVGWIGFPQTAVVYERRARAAGETKYTLGKMIRLALDGVVAFSDVPLRLASWLGLACAVVGVAVLTAVTAIGVGGGGWSWGGGLCGLALLLAGVQLLMLGVLGQYVGRTLDEVRGRPLYLVSQATGDGEAPVTPPRRGER